MKQQERNKGFSLVLVLISTMLILTLGLTILSVSAANMKMKTIEKDSKFNFYSAESALDEIYVGLEEIAMSQIEKAYTTFLKNYSDIYPASRDNAFKDLCMNAIYNKLTYPEFPKTTNSSEQIHAILNDLINHTPVYDSDTKVGVKINPSHSNPAEDVEASVTKKDEDHTITIHDIYVEFYNHEYKSVIQTDIKITCPSEAVFAGGNVGRSTNLLASYAIIANQQLSIGDDYNDTTSRVIGNVYAGKEGIVASCEGSKATIIGDTVVTNGNIVAKNKSSLVIAANSTSNNIWVNNIKTELQGFEPNKETMLTISGNCFVNNDLAINAEKSKVKITGTYNGFSTNTGSPNQNGSAILVNAKESTLDLSGVNDLTVAGNAFIEVPSYDSIGNPSDKEVLMGDSISLRGNQIAYLVPNECISVKHNPVLQNEYMSGVNVDLSLYSDINLKDYVSISPDGDDGFRKIFYRNASGEIVVYYYLYFSDEQKASEYIQRYNDKHNMTLANTMAEIFPGCVLNVQNATNNKSSGVLFTSNGSSITLLPNTVGIRSALNDNNNVNQTAYENMKRRLDKFDGTGTYDTAGKNFIKFDQIKTNYIKPDVQIIYNKEGSYADISHGEEIGEAYVVDNISTGLIIATGDVIVKSDFNGLIIAGGKVTILNRANVSACKDVVNDILGRNDNEINKYFKDIIPSSSSTTEATSSTGEMITLSNLLSYENWRKR